MDTVQWGGGFLLWGQQSGGGVTMDTVQWEPWVLPWRQNNGGSSSTMEIMSSFKRVKMRVGGVCVWDISSVSLSLYERRKKTDRGWWL